MHDYKPALQSHQRALAIRIKLFGEKHESTADSYMLMKETQNSENALHGCHLHVVGLLFNSVLL